MLPDGSLEHAQYCPALSCLTLELLCSEVRLGTGGRVLPIELQPSVLSLPAVKMISGLCLQL